MGTHQQMFNQDEKERLAKLRLNIGEAGDHAVQHLHDERELKILLHRLVEEGHFPSLVVAGSQFMKRYGFMTIASILYAFTMYNKPIQATPSRLSYKLDLDAEPWMITLAVTNKWNEIQSDRTEVRSQLANQLINENLAPFVETLVKVTKLSATILWENAAIYLFWLYETLIPSEGDAEQKLRAEEDFHYLLREFNCTSFTCGANPFMPYYSEKLVREADGPIRFRRTCCLYDQISEGGTCCKTCPKARK